MEKTIIFEKNALQNISLYTQKLSPPLSRILLVCDDCELARVIKQGLRDYRIATELAEDVSLVIGAGGEKSVYKAKKIAAENNLKVMVVSPPWCDALIRADSYVFAPEYILKSDIPSLYGGVVSRANSVCDAVIDSVFYDEKHVTNARKTVAVASSLANKQVTDEEVAEAAFKSAVLAQNLPFYGESAVAYLYSATQKTELSIGELRMIFAPALNALYLHHLCRAAYLTMPPDNEFRRIRLAELGVKCKARRLLMGRECLETEYKLSFCRKEIVALLLQARDTLKKGFIQFKSRYADLGFSLSSTAGDFSSVIALAPDACQSKGLLSILKDLGELDCYIG